MAVVKNNVVFAAYTTISTRRTMALNMFAAQTFRYPLGAISTGSTDVAVVELAFFFLKY